jgi:hypothetical protein
MNRRSLLGAGAAGALVLAGCGPKRVPSTAATRAGAAAGLPGGELQALTMGLVLEHAQLAAYTATAAAPGLSEDDRGLAREFAAIERQHIAALESVVRRQGGVPPQVVTGTVPTANPLAFCEALEERAGAAWLWVAQRATGLEVRAAVSSVMAVELRQRAGMRGALRQPMLASAPAPLPMPVAVARTAPFARRA